MLLRSLGLSDATYLRSTESSVTTSWGVRWSEDAIARDLLQNFYDANTDDLDQVKIDATTPTVHIKAPAKHNLEQLFYLGSEKDPTTNIGQYGEGFKAAATCLVRDHGVHPVARSGTQIACIRLSPTPVKGTQLHPLIYDWFEGPSAAGTDLILPNCGQVLRKAIGNGLSHFLHESNVLLGKKRWESHDNQFAIYDSAVKASGSVFYRRLRRGTIADIPVVLVINKTFPGIEKQLQNDRDRNAFGDKLRQLFFDAFARGAARYNHDVQRSILDAAKATWQRGHPLLAALAKVADWNPWPDKLSKAVFGANYFAKSESHNASEHLRFETIESAWRRDGRQPLPGYFRAFGVIDARHSVNLTLKKEAAKARRAPTAAERDAITLLQQVLHDVAPTIHSIFNQGETTYSIAQTEEILGTLRRGRHYQSREVFLAAQLFTSDFARALATFLHEHAHVYGYDGDRTFTDALTEVLETVIRTHDAIPSLQARWDPIAQRVREERTAQPSEQDGSNGIADVIADMSKEQLRELLHRIPPLVVRRAVNPPVADKEDEDID
jgi:hypothetical protein